MKSRNAALEKSYQFALDTIKVYKRLQKIKEFTMAKQLLRSGTSIGANVEEAIGGHSKQDFGGRSQLLIKKLENHITG